MQREMQAMVKHNFVALLLHTHARNLARNVKMRGFIDEYIKNQKKKMGTAAMKAWPMLFSAGREVKTAARASWVVVELDKPKTAQLNDERRIHETFTV